MNLVSSEKGLAEAIEAAARAAGEIALEFFRLGAATSAGITTKAGGSPVTDADFKVDAFLKDGLRRLLPDAGWLSEETVDSQDRLDKTAVWIVDPIDGTRAFAAGDRGWAVSVALVAKGRPVIGVIHAPALNETYVAIEHKGATRNGDRIAVSTEPLTATSKVALPTSLARQLRDGGMDFDLQPRIGSLAMRIARVASGALDLGFATDNSHDWDIAAADLILHEAGGILTDLWGEPPHYNRGDTRHRALVAAPARTHAEVVIAVRRAKQAADSERALAQR